MALYPIVFDDALGNATMETANELAWTGVMKRRSLLVGSGGLMLAAALGGCRSQPAGLRVDLLQNAIPPALLTDAQEQLRPTGFQIKSLKSLEALYEALQLYHQDRTADAETVRRSWQANVVSLGDAWLAGAIRNQLIQPLSPQQLPGWEQVPTPWQQLVQRNKQGFLDDAGSYWGAPYQWGSLAIAYRKDELADNPPTDWDALWRPELARRISLLDRGRAVLGLVLKHLGYSVNSEEVGAIAALPEALASLHQQVRIYSSDAYLEPLILGDTWLAVGWSTDILPLLKRNPRLGAVVPRSGTILTAELWVLPARSAPTPEPAIPVEDLIREWIQFYWQPEVATRLTLLGHAASPIVVGGLKGAGNDTAIDLPPSLQNNPLILPELAILDESEFLQPLSKSTAETYRRLWREMRQT